MSPDYPPSRMWPCLLLLALSTGCGLAEYEARARRTLERLQQYDADDALLGEPIYLSSELPIFLRLPREIAHHPTGQSQVQPLAHYPCVHAADKLAVLEAHVGFIPAQEVEVPDILLGRLLDELQSYSGGALEPVNTDAKTLEVQRSWESPQLWEANRGVRYRNWCYVAAKETPRTVEGQSAPLPEGFFVTYRYDIYMHYVEANQHIPRSGHMVIIFRQLDVAATRKRWEQILASRQEEREPPDRSGTFESSPQQAPSNSDPTAPNTSPIGATASTNPTSTTQPAPQSPQEVFRWLPEVDDKRLELAKQAALASLRLGEAARQRLACFGR
ncbi:MAG: hypothetical protein RMI91_10825 [Gemmatales bacterium]|nr:hypothetical protein [Gemmatales bacterium]MDW7995135.1 hypothetical protein [Gemmatales bacterium]